MPKCHLQICVFAVLQWECMVSKVGSYIVILKSMLSGRLGLIAAATELRLKGVNKIKLSIRLMKLRRECLCSECWWLALIMFGRLECDRQQVVRY